MELIQHRFSYSDFGYVNNNLTGNSVNYILSIKNSSGFTSYDETTFDYNGITNALYNKFPPNQFSTSPGDTLSGYTIVNVVEPHNINIGGYVLLKPLFGDDNLLGLNYVDDIGDALGGNPDHNLWIHKPYTAHTSGLAVIQINEVLSFFKGFNIQPTYTSINTYFNLVESYLDSPDVNTFRNVGIGEYIRNTPRRLFNELGFEITYTGGSNTAFINLPVYLTQTIQNIGLYDLPYSSTTDNNTIDINSVPNSYYRKYNILREPSIVVESNNNFTYIFADGITANTYSDFFEVTSSTISGVTSDKSLKVSRYGIDGIRYGYQLPSDSSIFRYTLTRNTTPNINDGYIEYTTIRPLSASTTSTFKYNTWGRSPQNNNVGNINRTFVNLVHDEFNDQLILEPKIKNSVFIDRGIFSPFERVYKLGDLKSIEDITSFERGEFNVVSGLPLERIYLTNG